jgi:hypothetical protein
VVGLPVVRLAELFKLIFPVFASEALPVIESEDDEPVRLITPPLLFVYREPLLVANELLLPAVMVPEFERLALDPKLILAPEPVSVIVPPTLLVIAVVKELGPAVDNEQPVNVKAPLLTKNPGVLPELMPRPPLLKLMVLPAPIVSVVVL